MPNESAVCARLDTVTTTLSTNIRTLAVGLLAFNGSLLLTAFGLTDKPAPKFPLWLESRLLAIAGLAFAALLFDVLQFRCSYWHTRRTLKKIDEAIKEKRKKDPDFKRDSIDIDYDDKSFPYRCTLIFFEAKVASLIVATLWLVVDVFIYARGQIIIGH